MAATVTVRGNTWNTTAGDKTVTAVPAVGDLIVIIASSSGLAGGTTAVSDNQGGTYVQVDVDRTGFSTTGVLTAWIRTALIPAASSTIFTASQGASSGGGLSVLSVSGMSLTGASAVRSSGGQSTVVSGTPAPVLSSTPLSSNPIITAIGTGSNVTTNVVPRTGYTEDADLGYNTPATGLEVSHLASGETSATLTYGGAAASQFASIAIELQYNTSPTTVLNSPADASSASDTTPTLDFTGTDADGDSIEYNVQIDTSSTFDSHGSTIDSYSETNSNTIISFDTTSGSNDSIGQSFTGDGSVLGSVQWYLNKTGTPTGGVLTAYIYAHTGTFGTTGVPTGSPLATSDSMAVDNLTTTLTLYPFHFYGSNQITLTNGTNYCVVIKISGGFNDASNRPNTGRDSTSPAHSGIISRNLSGTWAVIAGNDAPFYVFAPSATFLDKYSVTPDTGFVNPDTGGDTHPFNSGENIQYTVQAGDALATGTYYWRVRGIDPAGLNTYGVWSSTRSFTITSGGATPNSGFFGLM